MSRPRRSARASLLGPLWPAIVLLAACGTGTGSDLVPDAVAPPSASAAASAVTAPGASPAAAAPGASPAERAVDGAADSSPSRSPGAPSELREGHELLGDRPSALTPPPQPPQAAAVAPGLVADHCTDRELPAPAAGGDPVLAVIDASYGLAPDYVPPDLVPATVAGFSTSPSLVRAVLVPDLAALAADARAAGLQLVIESAYRSHAEQSATFHHWAGLIGVDGAMRRVARPGHSEHQLGTSIDFVSPGWSGRFGDWAIETAEGVWLAEHGWRYGFVMSYPPGAEAVSCLGYEPWHYRWIGRDVAAEWRASGLVLREFLARRAGALAGG